MINKVTWLEIRVTDMKSALAFYRDTLGLKVRKEWSYYAIFELPGTITLALMLGGKKSPKEGAPNIYLQVDNLDEEYKLLKEKGVNFLEAPKKQYWGGYAVRFVDQDENLFYLVQKED